MHHGTFPCQSEYIRHVRYWSPVDVQPFGHEYVAVDDSGVVPLYVTFPWWVDDSSGHSKNTNNTKIKNNEVCLDGCSYPFAYSILTNCNT